MLVLNNEPENGMVVTVTRIPDSERRAGPIPAGEMVAIVGVGLDESGDAALWVVAYNGAAFWAFPEELRPARTDEVEILQNAY